MSFVFFFIGISIFLFFNIFDSISYTKKNFRDEDINKSNFITNSAYIRAWKKSFNTTSNTSRSDFQKFVFADLFLTIFLFAWFWISLALNRYEFDKFSLEKIVGVPLILLQIFASHFPRVCIYLRRLRNNSRADANVLWMFLPVIGWIISWFYGGEFGYEGKKVNIRKENNDVESKLSNIKQLFDKGLINQEEYEKKKWEILNDV